MNDQSLPILPIEAIRVGIRQELAEIDFKLDCTLEVLCDRVQSFPANRTTPAERGGLIVNSVYLFGTDITKHLSESELEDIEGKVNGSF